MKTTFKPFFVILLGILSFFPQHSTLAQRFTNLFDEPYDAPSTSSPEIEPLSLDSNDKETSADDYYRKALDAWSMGDMYEYKRLMRKSAQMGNYRAMDKLGTELWIEGCQTSNRYLQKEGLNWSRKALNILKKERDAYLSRGDRSQFYDNEYIEMYKIWRDEYEDRSNLLRELEKTERLIEDIHSGYGSGYYGGF
ncbi:MAG: hypothetical protein Q4D38_02045 [Planctomycetia bacterium]|nr:hypothetical protein [Planctomycetia bacterium]